MQQVQQRLAGADHGDFRKWQQAISSLPPIQGRAQIHYGDTISIRADINSTLLQQALMQLHPWRKGPFQLGEVLINSEWRSDMKWRRLQQHMQVDGCLHRFLEGQRVLDIGCGNGYFGWRMLEAGAAEVIGVDPTLLFCMQHQAIQHYVQDWRNWVLPLSVEELPESTTFGAVFSMGVIYHRRDAAAHVQQMYNLTGAGGTAVLESIVTRGENLIPDDRYARMRNVWCIPNPQQLVSWMQSAGFEDCRILDISTTDTEEQRSTDWMTFESLKQALHQDDPKRTIEGYPAPVRAIVMGRRKQADFC